MFEDPANRSRLAKLIRFQSSASTDGLTSLSEYVSRMKPKQDHIYYVAGATRTEVFFSLEYRLHAFLYLFILTVYEIFKGRKIAVCRKIIEKRL